MFFNISKAATTQHSRDNSRFLMIPLLLFRHISIRQHRVAGLFGYKEGYPIDSCPSQCKSWYRLTFTALYLDAMKAPITRAT